MPPEDISAEELSNLTSALKDFTKLLQKTNKDLLRSENSFKNMSSHQKDINKALPKTIKMVKSIEESVGNLVGNLANGLSATFFGGITGYSAHIIKDAIKLDTITHQTAIRMGMGVEGVKTMKGAVNDLQKNFGAAYQDAAELVNELTERHYVDNVAETAASINLMSRATGESASNLVQFSDHLSKAAGMSQKAITATMASMTKAQQAVGLSRAGMTAVVDTVQKAAEKMAAFGKTEAEIKKMATSTVLLASSMEKVGISAGDAAALVEKLTDPDRIEDNIMLYSQLGISMQDALEGNIDISQDQLKELGQKIADMGPIAGKQLAQSMGMSYTDAVKMSKLEAPEVDVGQVEVSEDGALEALDEMTKKTEGIELSVKRFFNSVEGRIRKLGPVVIGMIGVLLPVIISKAVKAFGELFSHTEKQASVFTEALGDAISTTVKKTGEEVVLVAKTGAKNWLSAFTAVLAEHNPFNDFTTKSEAVFERAAQSIGKGFLAEFANAGVDNLAAVYQEQMNKITAENENWKKQLTELNIKFEEVEGGLIDISQEISSKLTPQQSKFYDMARAAIDANAKATEDLKQKRLEVLGISKKDAETLEAYTKYQEVKNALDEKSKSINDDVSKLQQEQIVAMAEQQKLQEQASKAAKTGNDIQAEAFAEAAKQQEEIAKQKAIDIALQSHELIYQKEIAEVQKALIEATKAGDAQAISDAKQLLKAKEDEHKKVEKSIKGAETLKDAYLTQGAYAEKIKDTIKEISEIEPPEVVSEEELAKAKNLAGRLAPLAKGIKTKIITTWENSKLMKGWRDAVAEINKARAEKGKSSVGLVRGAVKIAGKKAGEATFGAVKGIAKTLGPMAIVMAIVGKFVDKFRDKFETMIDNLMKDLEPVMEVIMPIISDLMNIIVKQLFPPVLKLLATGLKVLNFLLKPVIGILRLCENIPGIGGALKGTADALEAATGEDTQKALINAADKIANSTEDFTSTVKEKEKDESKPMALTVQGGQAVVSERASTSTAASPEVSSTTQTVSEKKTADDTVKEQENAKDRKDSKKLRDFLTGTSAKDLPTLFNELIAAVNNLTALFSQSNALNAAPQKIGNPVGTDDTSIPNPDE
jgi:hypothetical protein